VSLSALAWEQPPCTVPLRAVLSEWERARVRDCCCKQCYLQRGGGGEDGTLEVRIAFICRDLGNPISLCLSLTGSQFVSSLGLMRNKAVLRILILQNFSVCVCMMWICFQGSQTWNTRESHRELCQYWLRIVSGKRFSCHWLCPPVSHVNHEWRGEGGASSCNSAADDFAEELSQTLELREP